MRMLRRLAGFWRGYGVRLRNEPPRLEFQDEMEEHISCWWSGTGAKA
jgi:hypothetical protein